jgi:hypothetical protein
MGSMHSLSLHLKSKPNPARPKTADTTRGKKLKTMTKTS